MAAASGGRTKRAKIKAAINLPTPDKKDTRVSPPLGDEAAERSPASQASHHDDLINCRVARPPLTGGESEQKVEIGKPIAHP